MCCLLCNYKLSFFISPFDCNASTRLSNRVSLICNLNLCVNENKFYISPFSDELTMKTMTRFASKCAQKLIGFHTNTNQEIHKSIKMNFSFFPTTSASSNTHELRSHNHTWFVTVLTSSRVFDFLFSFHSTRL